MKFAANLSLLWPELPYLDRFDAAAAAGFRAVEILFPYETPAQETRAALRANALSLILINAPPPNYTGGPRGFAAQPEAVDRFRHDMRRAFRYAGALQVPMIHVMAGEAQGAAAQATFVANLRWAATEAPAGTTLTIEPLNPVAMPGYFLNDYDLAADVLADVGAPNVALQYDSYHAQMIHGDAVGVLDRHRDLVAHVQLGDSPDRSAPGSGEVDFKGLFKRLEATGFAGYVSGEYHPGGPTEKTLNWMKHR